MRVVFCASEMVPFAKTGGLADVCGALPLALEKTGVKPVIVLPRYRSINLKEIAAEKLTPEVFRTKIGKDIPVYLIEKPEWFDRNGIYGEHGIDYADNLYRFHFYCQKTLEILKEFKVKADIVHAHDWQAALVPVLAEFKYAADPFFKKMKFIFTIHNLAYQGIFPGEQFSGLGLDAKLFSPQGMEFYGQVNLMKGGLVFSDRVTTVSPRYAQEILTEPFGCGLDGVLRSRQDKILGILNGLDTEIWDPASDGFIAQKYSAQKIEGKAVNKARLQKSFGLPVKKEAAVLGLVGRLSYQKGLDLLAKALDKMMRWDVQVVFLGIGEAKYHHFVKEAAARYPEKVACQLQFSEGMAHLVYAGADIFLMPSVYEPCGLSQMISLRYGTIPLVFKTGGLADTVTGFKVKGQGNGFVFEKYTPEAFLECLKEALDLFRRPTAFLKLVKRAFTYDFSWDKAAGEYKQLYESL